MEEHDTNTILSLAYDEESMTAAAVATTSDQQEQNDVAVQMSCGSSDQQLTVSVTSEEARMVDENTSVVGVRPPKRQKMGN